MHSNKSRTIKDLALTNKSAYIKIASQYQFKYHSLPKRPNHSTEERILYQLDQEDIQLASLPLPLRDAVIETIQHHDELLKKPSSPIVMDDTYFQSFMSIHSHSELPPMVKTPPKKYSIIQPAHFVPLHRKAENQLLILRQEFEEKLSEFHQWIIDHLEDGVNIRHLTLLPAQVHSPRRERFSTITTELTQTREAHVKKEVEKMMIEYDAVMESIGKINDEPK